MDGQIRGMVMNDNLPHLIVFGSRVFSDFDLLCERLDHYTSGLGKLVLIHGTADGADKLAERWAFQHKHTVMQFYPDWDLGKLARPVRNQEMIDCVLPKRDRFAIAFWDGKSKGTSDMIARVKRANITLRIVRW